VGNSDSIIEVADIEVSFITELVGNSVSIIEVADIEASFITELVGTNVGIGVVVWFSSAEDVAVVTMTDV